MIFRFLWVAFGDHRGPGAAAIDIPDDEVIAQR
jgi:hypothetical protein